MYTNNKNTQKWKEKKKKMGEKIDAYEQQLRYK